MPAVVLPIYPKKHGLMVCTSHLCSQWAYEVLIAQGIRDPGTVPSRPLFTPSENLQENYTMTTFGRPGKSAKSLLADFRNFKSKILFDKCFVMAGYGKT